MVTGTCAVQFLHYIPLYRNNHTAERNLILLPLQERWRRTDKALYI